MGVLNSTVALIHALCRSETPKIASSKALERFVLWALVNVLQLVVPEEYAAALERAVSE
jgi:hypothetical protein